MLYRIHYDSQAQPEALWRVCSAIARRGITVLWVYVEGPEGEVLLSLAGENAEQLLRSFRAVPGVRRVYSIEILPD